MTNTNWDVPGPSVTPCYQPHPKADILRLIADGVPVQRFSAGLGRWCDLDPSRVVDVHVDGKYRRKPDVVRYRVALLRHMTSTPTQVANGEPVQFAFAPYINTEPDGSPQNAAAFTNFVRWLTDWQEVQP